MSDRYGYIAIETLLNFCENSKDHAVTPNDFMRMARVQVPERKKGKWRFIGYQMFECTECGTFYTQSQFQQMRVLITDPDFPRFCPTCGADMREEGGE